MKENRQEKLKISNEMLDAMLVGVKTQEDLWVKEGVCLCMRFFLGHFWETLSVSHVEVA